MLEKNLEQNEEILSAINGMKFLSLKKSYFDKCGSLEELKLTLADYFTVNLSSIKIWGNSEKEEFSTRIWKLIEKITNLPELVAISRNLFKLIYESKIKLITLRKWNVFYPNLEEQNNKIHSSVRLILIFLGNYSESN